MSRDVTPGRAGVSPALLGFVGLIAFGGLLEVLPRLGVVNPDYFPPSSAIASALAEQAQRPEFWHAFGDTLLTWLIGLVIAVTEDGERFLRMHGR